MPLEFNAHCGDPCDNSILNMYREVASHMVSLTTSAGKMVTYLVGMMYFDE